MEDSFIYITKFLSDEQKQKVQDIVVDVVRKMSEDNKTSVDNYYGPEFYWDVTIGRKSK